MQVDAQLAKLIAFCDSRDYAGYDPYDALNSPLVRALTLGTKWGRIAWTQLFRRLPINLRPLFLVPAGHNPKGIGLFLWGYAKLFASCQNSQVPKLSRHSETSGTTEERIGYLISLLEGLRSTGYAGNCWGYNFDWQSRAAFVPKWTPTIVNSAFIGHALLDTFEHTGNQSALDLAAPIGDFILNDLNRKQEGDTFCFSYTPIDDNYVHNANLLGASLLLRLSRVANDQSLRDPASAALAYSLKHQHDDGSWYYAETEFQKWIDSFHTGFNLQALRYFLKAGYEDHQDAYNRGRDYYAKHFFLADGTPKYYHDRTYPIDIHAPTQAIAFFSGEGNKYQALTDRVLGWMMANMWDDRGFFYFRKTPRCTNRIPYMRWSQAWAFHALTEYALQNSLQPQGTDNG